MSVVPILMAGPVGAAPPPELELGLADSLAGADDEPAVSEPAEVADSDPAADVAAELEDDPELSVRPAPQAATLAARVSAPVTARSRRATVLRM